ncbi:hypothetical protein C8R44DRAFT_745910 [Mycena epipterygia]|nr:hypothetical protein C8R44DRAFT_745910 [Mycena epipterygia]
MFASPRKKRKADIRLPDETALDRLLIATFAAGKDEGKKLLTLYGSILAVTKPIKVAIHGLRGRILGTQCAAQCIREKIRTSDESSGRAIGRVRTPVYVQLALSSFIYTLLHTSKQSFVYIRLRSATFGYVRLRDVEAVQLAPSTSDLPPSTSIRVVDASPSCQSHVFIAVGVIFGLFSPFTHPTAL